MATPTLKPFDPSSMTRSELAFHMKAPFYNNTIIDSETLRQRVQLSHPQTWNAPKALYAGMGNLDKLPLELQFSMFAMTPISDLFSLRQSNSYAKYIIEQWIPFRTIMTYAADAVRALLTTQAGHQWTAPQLVDVLLTTKCELCGEHGEILQLIKFKRCCLRCLSQERELLAVNRSYPQQQMNLSPEDLKQLPAARTINQMNFWGFPSASGPAYDYQAALELVRHRTGQDGQGTPLKQPARRKAFSWGWTFRRTGLALPLEWQRKRAPQTRPRIQERRGQRPLQLLEEEITPPETMYVQHGCSVRLPAMTRQFILQQDGTKCIRNTVIPAVHCEGCAFYWNHHSPLPWQFHRLYPHTDGAKDTAFTKHLKECVYAHLHWTLLYLPWSPRSRAEVINVLGEYHQTFYNRHPASTIEQSNSAFEMISLPAMLTMEAHDQDRHAFQSACTWPSSNGEDEDSKYYCAAPESHASFLRRQRLRARTRLNPPTKQDYYWDALFSQEALSQSNWACANVWSGQISLFRGPASLLIWQWKRANEKYICPRTKDGMQPTWGFDRFGK